MSPVGQSIQVKQLRGHSELPEVGWLRDMLDTGSIYRVKTGPQVLTVEQMYRNKGKTVKL